MKPSSAIGSAVITAAVLAAAWLFYAHFNSDSRAVERLIEDARRLAENEAAKDIRKMVTEDFPASFIARTENFFDEHHPLKIKIVNTMKETGKNYGKAAIAVIITSELEGLGRVTGRQTVGLRLRRTGRTGYRGWRVSEIAID